MEFLYINVLLFMLIPIIIFVFLIATKKSLMQKLFPEDILNKLMVNNNYLSKKGRNFLLFVALILMTIALARPVIDKKEISIEQEVTPIIVAIDVSKSMLAQDISPNRLSLAKHKLKEIIKQSSHNAVGVLLFAKSAFILSPVTQDFSSLAYLVENFDNGLNFDNGSNIYAVIEAANKLFKNFTNKNLLILSDGANKNDFTQEIDLANKLGISVYTLAIATTQPSPIKIGDQFLTDKENNIVTVKLNESIKELSLNTNGGYINYTINNSDINAILKDIEQKSSKDQLQKQKHKTYTELFYYPLALSLFLMLLAFSSLPKKNLALLLLFMTGLPDTSHASLFDFQTINKANVAYDNKEYQKASSEFKKVSQSKEGHYNYANALYKNNQYEKALSEYKKVITSDSNLEFKKLHNMGNTYVKLNKLEDAVKMYEKALTLNKDKDTKENLERVKEALKQQNKNQQSPQSQNEKKQKNKQKDKQDSQQKSQQNSENKKKQQEKNKKEEQAKKEDESNKTKKEKDEKQQKSQDKFTQQKMNQQTNQEHISDLEEKKWMNQLQKQKTPILLRKVESKHKQEENTTPW